ncbi:MAG: chaperonin GroEL, partial [Planctomycetota bacterium]|nr:chaperonin GroEL [Planctomycetota bacterium]
GKGVKTELEFVKGMQFDKGYISPYFINKPANLTVELEDPYILLFEKKISSVREILGVLEAVAQTGKPLFVVAEEVEGEALAVLIVNRIRGILSCCAVKAPAFGDRRKAILEDIAILTGGTLISEDLGMKLENIKISHLGRARKVVVEKEKTTIVEGAGDKSKIEERMRQIRRLRDETTSDYDREKFEERLAKLSGGVAIIRAGAPTETDMKELKMRIDDAVHAAQAAAEEGVVPGGGLAYMRAIPAIEKLKLEGDEAFGAKMVALALETNCRQLALNHGLDGSVVVEDVKAFDKKNVGFNALTGKYEDLVAAGIIEPLKVVKTALRNGASIAGTLLSSRGLITELKSKKKAVAASVS